jgi:hypothetical protein
MQAGHINNATRNLEEPKGWDTKARGRCRTLVVRDELTTAGIAMTSAWFPAIEEMERIVRGAPIYLTVFGNLHPPVCMSIGPTPD